MKRVAQRLLRTALRAGAFGVTVLATIWLVRGLDARKLPDLSIWHTYNPQHEFRAHDYPHGISLAAYQQLEMQLAAELDENIYAVIDDAGSEQLNRYNKQSLVYAGSAGQAWNRSFEIDVPAARGGILLLHGASDSPYSMRALAEEFAARGLYVAVFRLPGHGTVPAGLKHARVADWVAIARSGVAHVATRVGPGKPVYVGGYSAGAAVVLDYALDAATDNALLMPERVLLYSPAIAVTPFARFGDWDEALALLPFFRKLSWISIETEYDPYKYNSFPKNGGYLSFAFSERVISKLASLASRQPESLPPIIAFQSLIDSTVRTDSLVHDLFRKLPANGSELVLFDFNRAERIQHFVVDSQRALLDELARDVAANFSYTLVTNRSAETGAVEARTRSAGAAEIAALPLQASWPADVYSLSHVAIPFRATDEWYGANGPFSAIARRGDQAILQVPLGRLMRLRYNPFFDYVAERSLAFLH
ncbi:MAG: alpha/beta fold hydrolase [Gammaproteobacteria bacterium]|nr:alpha/beta fold hydrolase [Gammaproteobacteria bacterium]